LKTPVSIIISESQTITKPTMYCRRCGYVLDGLSDHRCPECGRPFDPANRRTYRTTPRRRWSWKIIGALIGFGVVAIPTVVLAIDIYFNTDPGSPGGAGLLLSFLAKYSFLAACVSVPLGALVGWHYDRRKRREDEG